MRIKMRIIRLRRHEGYAQALAVHDQILGIMWQYNLTLEEFGVKSGHALDELARESDRQFHTLAFSKKV